MTHKYDNIEVLSVKEAALFANLFDELGEYHNANLMDDYIRKMAEAEGDLVKQAGLFRNLLRKLVGFGKRVFFKVYRELYAKAKEAQERLDDRIDAINEAYGQIKKDLRYHDLEGWRGGIYSLNLADSKEIMGEFDVAYGKLVQYLGLTGESEKAKEGEPPAKEDKSQIGKLPDLSEPEEEKSEEGKPGSWERMTPGAKEGWTELARSVAFSPSKGAIRFDKKYFDYLLGKHLSTDGTGNVKYWSSYGEQKQPMGGKLKDMMGDSTWEMREDESYVYLYPTSRGTDVGAPPVETKPEKEEETYEAEFESPEIPKPEGGVEKPEMPEEEPPEEPEEETTEEPEEAPEEEPEEAPEETPEEAPEEAPEEKPEEAKPSPAELAVRQSPRQTAWVEISRPARKKDGELWTRFTKVYPQTVKRYQRTGGGTPVQDPDLIAFLDNGVPREFPGHKANVNKIWLPTDLDRRKEFVEMAQRNWAETDAKKTKASRLEMIQALYKVTTREKWLK